LKGIREHEKRNLHDMMEQIKS